MNREESKYVAKRLTEITDRKISAIKAEYEVKELSRYEKFELIKLGDVKMLPFSELDCYTQLYSCYDFSDFEPNKPDYEQRNARIKYLQEHSDQLKDMIILGNSDKALYLLSKFIEEDF